MSVVYDENNIPYEGDLRKAMTAKDRQAIRFLMQRKPVIKNEASPKKKAEEDKTTCMICMDKFNGGRRYRIECPNCEKGCCQMCFRKHLLTSSSTDPECANCNHKFSLEFVAGCTPKVFHNSEYRIKRARDLMSRERSLLPATQTLVIDQQERKKREEQIYELMDEAKYLRERLREIRGEIHDLQMLTRNNSTQEKKERKKFIMGCPVEDCRGFLSQAWKCGTCGTHVCPKCRVPKACKNDEAHVCKKEDIATAELLTKDTKPCPSCAVPIFKIEGCDQMWCVECHTPFSWRTGMPVTGVIHNPHFYQYQRNQNGGVAPRRGGQRYNCGGLPWVRAVREVMKQRNYKFFKWEDCHRSVGHIRAIFMPRYPARVDMEDHSDLRVRFLLKEIDEDEWLKQLQRRQKKIEKNQEIHNVLDMYLVTLTDLFQRFMIEETDLCRQSHGLRKYVNGEMCKISDRYANVVPIVNRDWSVSVYR